MRTLLVLTDFSEPAFRAAEYACSITAPLRIERIILYHAYQTYIGGTEIPIMQDGQQLYLQSMQLLGMQHDRLKPLLDPAIKIDLLAEDAVLTERIFDRAAREGVAALVMGVSGKSALEQLLVGNITSDVLRTSELPVLVVPEGALVGRPVTSIVFATDLEDVNKVSGELLHAFLSAFNAQLYIVNVMPEGEEKYSGETFESISALHRQLERYNPTFGYVTRDDVVEGILSFSAEKKASLIMAVPKKHGFFASIFHKSVSKKLAYNSDLPLLFLPGLE